MQASVTSVSQEMPTRCAQSMGAWDSATGVCQYPSAVAPTGATATATAAQQTEQQNCLVKGGQALYTAAGAFVCLIADTTPPKDPGNVAFANRYCSSTNVTMSWTTDTTDASLKTHSVKLCTANDCSTGCTLPTSADGTSTTMTGSSDTTYFGCVQAVDTSGNRSQWIASALPVTIDTSFRFADGSATCNDSNMIVSWEPVAGATNYDISIYDRTCATLVGQSYDHVSGTTLAASEDLAPDTLYCVKVVAKDDAGDTIASSSVVDDFGNSYNAAISSHDMVFERAYYQTRSIKRLLVDSTVLPSTLTSASVAIAGTNLTCSIARGYTAPYSTASNQLDALVFDDQAMLDSKLSYGTTPTATGLTLSAAGMATTSLQSSVIMDDFAIQSLTTTSFSNGAQVMNNYQGWVNTVSSSISAVGGNILINGFERIVNY